MPVGKPRRFVADKGYDADVLSEEFLLQGIRPVIPPKTNRKAPPVCDLGTCKDRNRIKRMFNRIKQFRRVATRYDKTNLSMAPAPGRRKNVVAILCQQDLVAQRCKTETASKSDNAP